MADFLTNLVNRLSQQTIVVQARPVSMFEPQTHLDLSAWVVPGQPTTETGEPIDQKGNQEARESTSVLLEQPRQPQATIEPRTHSALAETITKPGNPATSGPSFRLGYLLNQPASQWDQPPRESQNHPENKPISKEDTAQKPLMNATPEVKIHLREGHANTHQERHPLEPSALSSIRPNPLEAEKSRKAVHTNLQISTQKDPSLAEPAINVTIGRVEVIAVPPSVPAKPEKPSQPRPVMSLDEYLKSREQEGQT